MKRFKCTQVIWDPEMFHRPRFVCPDCGEEYGLFDAMRNPCCKKILDETQGHEVGADNITTTTIEVGRADGSEKCAP